MLFAVHKIWTPRVLGLDLPSFTTISAAVLSVNKDNDDYYQRWLKDRLVINTGFKKNPFSNIKLCYNWINKQDIVIYNGYMSVI